MQSRVATAAASLFAPQKQSFFRRIASGAAVGGRTADPSIHSGELEAGPAVHKGEPQGVEKSSHRHTLNEVQTETEPESDCETEPLMQPRMPHDSSPRLKSSPVNLPLEPNLQQRRTISAAALEGVSCAGLDGTPWPEIGKENDQSDKKAQAMDNKEYYSRHKASPLSEINIVDTRKPITRATDGTVTEEGQRKGDVIGWLPEQLDTAEEALLRAARIWKENAMRGIPEAPHSRVLRELRGEWF